MIAQFYAPNSTVYQNPSFSTDLLYLLLFSFFIRVTQENEVIPRIMVFDLHFLVVNYVDVFMHLLTIVSLKKCLFKPFCPFSDEIVSLSLSYRTLYMCQIPCHPSHQESCLSNMISKYFPPFYYLPLNC